MTLEEVDGISVRLVVSAVDASGNASDPVEVAPPRRGRVAKLALGEPQAPEADPESDLAFGAGNYPNPFNPSTTIWYTLPEASRVRLVIYNVLGQQVRVLVNAAQAAGTHRVVWDGRDRFGRGVATGLYLYRLEAGVHVAMRKIVFAK